VVVSEDGRSIIPLLGGHKGGNELAVTVAREMRVEAAITTASDSRFGIALDDPPQGWVLANPSDHKAFAATLLDGATCSLEGSAAWIENSALPLVEDGDLRVHVTDKQRQGSPRALVYHPRRLAIGVGCERGVEAAELRALVRGVLDTHGFAESAVAGLFSLDLKSDEAAIHALADELGVAARFFDAATLEAQTARLVHPSRVVFEEVGCHGVSEAAALTAAGNDGELLVAKTKSRRATCAVARAVAPLDARALGRPQGRLSIVGLGPGKRDWCTPEARSTVDTATQVVGFQGYMDLAGPLLPGQTAHPFQLGEEEDRVRKAFELAAAGHSVALVCSGDPGIYAMASLAYELLDRQQCPEWQRVALRVVPGISAVQGAAARIGAPLGHDFCLISLSDLLTPWPVIENRLEAAARGDFVVALYNPASAKRTRQLARATAILARHRSAETPVMVARNVGRLGEAIQIMALSELGRAQVDMLSLVIVGSSTSRRMQAGGSESVYTPRGYDRKSTPEAVA
jgi:cobalt-precorrin 5A hydrolase/precorrin-3B C17-methyltransferase